MRHNLGYYNQINGVPEYLNELGHELPMAHIAGSDLAVHSPAWANSHAAAYRSALIDDPNRPGEDPWSTPAPRG